MSQIIQNRKSVFTSSDSKPIYVYSDYDESLLEITKNQQFEGEQLKGISRFFPEDKFKTTRITKKDDVQKVFESDSLIVNLSFGEKCLIGIKNDEELDAGMAVSAYPDLVSGEYMGLSRIALPKFAISFFANKFGEINLDEFRSLIEDTELSQEDYSQFQSLEEKNFSLEVPKIDVNQTQSDLLQ